MPIMGIREFGALPPELSDADRASPISDSVIARGRSIIQSTQADQTAGDVLSRSGLPAIGSRVTVAMPGGEVIDAFSEQGRDGIRIRLDDGRMFEEFSDGLAERGITIAPEVEAIEPEIASAAPIEGLADQPVIEDQLPAETPEADEPFMMALDLIPDTDLNAPQVSKQDELRTRMQENRIIS